MPWMLLSMLYVRSRHQYHAQHLAMLGLLVAALRMLTPCQNVRRFLTHQTCTKLPHMDGTNRCKVYVVRGYVL